MVQFSASNASSELWWACSIPYLYCNKTTDNRDIPERVIFMQMVAPSNLYAPLHWFTCNFISICDLYCNTSVNNRDIQQRSTVMQINTVMPLYCYLCRQTLVPPSDAAMKLRGFGLKMHIIVKVHIFLRVSCDFGWKSCFEKYGTIAISPYLLAPTGALYVTMRYCYPPF